MVADPDLQQVAKDAIEAGLFDADANAVHANAAIVSEFERLPLTLLDVPYVNGPIAIELYGRNIPEAAIFSVRRNFTEANRLLLPKEQVLRYFHQRFVADDVFDADPLVSMVQNYRAPTLLRVDERVSHLFRQSLFHHGAVADLTAEALRPLHAGGVEASHMQAAPNEPSPRAITDGVLKPFRDPELSFRTRGVDRKSHVRSLYTREEQAEGLRLVQDCPALVLAILAYQSLIQQYLAALRQAFETVASVDALSDFDKYAAQWGTANFTTELVPALAIFAVQRQRERSTTETPNGRVVDAELFRSAVDFTVANGAFRNWIPVPADDAGDRVEQVKHFLCPAVGTIREQLLDGSLFAAIYRTITAKENAQDDGVLVFLELIRAEAATKLSEGDWTPTDEDLARMQKQVTMSFSYQRRAHILRLDEPALEPFMRGDPKRNDVTIAPPIGSWFYDIAREAITITLARKTAVFFQFNGRSYRLTPGRLADFLRTVG